jgi:hypothetical protein
VSDYAQSAPHHSATRSRQKNPGAPQLARPREKSENHSLGVGAARPIRDDQGVEQKNLGLAIYDAGG